MRIELDKLGKKGTDFAHVYQPNELAIDEEGIKLKHPLELTGNIKLDGQQVRVKGILKTLAETDCDRCLQPISVPVDAGFDVIYVPVKEYVAAETPELNVDDLSVDVFDDESIDIDDLAREQMLLAMPSRSLCRDDCKGLCPVCGINKNMQACQCESTDVDPRWAALKDLRF